MFTMDDLLEIAIKMEKNGESISILLGKLIPGN